MLSNYFTKAEGPLFNRRYVYFLAFKGLVNNNFNHLIFLFKKIVYINTFFGKRNRFHQTFAKIHSSILPFFFLMKLLSLKVYKKSVERGMQKRIQNSAKNLIWSFLHKQLMSFSCFINSFILNAQLSSEQGSGIFSVS